MPTIVTWWNNREGYVRAPASAAFETFINTDTNNFDQSLHLTGWEEIDGQDETVANDLEIKLYEHTESEERFVDLGNCGQGLSRLHVAADDVDAFMFTEYLRIRREVHVLTTAEDIRQLRRGVVSFIRHGHGTTTVSEFGMTKDERNNEIARQKTKESRQQPGA